MTGTAAELTEIRGREFERAVGKNRVKPNIATKAPINNKQEEPTDHVSKIVIPLYHGRKQRASQRRGAAFAGRFSGF